MKHLIVSKSLAVKLKQAKFTAEVFAFYLPASDLLRYTMPPTPGYNLAHRIEAPLYTQVVDWFEITHNIYIECPNYYKTTKDYKPEYECRVNGKQLSTTLPKGAGGQSEGIVLFPTREEAYERAILEALKLIDGTVSV